MKEIFNSTFPGTHGGAVMLTGSKQHRYGGIQTRLVPCSTFKLVLSLAGLESGVIPSAKTVWRWNGEQVGRPEWRKDMDLAMALQESSEWYFREVARKLGEKRLRSTLQELDYGSGWKGKKPEDAWVDGSLTISPQEQAALASKLATGSLPFAKEYQAIVRQSLRVQKTGRYALWGKTGSSAKGKDGRSLGWYVGAYTDDGQDVAFAIVRHLPNTIGPMVRDEVVKRLIK
jgi:beta-lactamase class D